MKFKCPHCKQKNKRPKISDFWREKNVHCIRCGKHIYIKGGSDLKAHFLELLAGGSVALFVLTFCASFLYFSTTFSTKGSIFISLALGGIILLVCLYGVYRLEKRWFTVYAEDTKTQTTKNEV